MITFLEGMLVEKMPTCAVINVGGIGWEIFIALSTYERLPNPGENCRLLIHEYWREDQHSLFGFSTTGERDVFGKLMSVGGIGPKLALSALSSLTVRDLILAVASGNVEVLSSISGIGKKKAERMIVELREQFAEMAVLDTRADIMRRGEGEDSLRDAVQALIALGYRAIDAHKKAADVMASSGSEISVEEIVRLALRR